MEDNCDFNNKQRRRTPSNTRTNNIGDIFANRLDLVDHERYSALWPLWIWAMEENKLGETLV